MSSASDEDMGSSANDGDVAEDAIQMDLDPATTTNLS